MKDTLGRENRKLPNHLCPHCGKAFRPLRADSKYCSKPCKWANNGKNQRRKPECWWENQKGYIEGKIWLDDKTQIRVKKHRFIMEGLLGRPLSATEDVHHINGIKSDNRPENLEVVEHGEHTKKSNASRTYKKGYRLNLTENERRARSLRAIASQLTAMGRAAIAKARQGDA